MDIPAVKIQLAAILQHLPGDYSQQAARKLMLAFENYKQIARSLVNNYSVIRSGVHSEFEDIEADIKMAIKGTPKKEAALRFGEARKHMEHDIKHILGVNEQQLDR
jgi:hypothetical protein